MLQFEFPFQFASLKIVLKNCLWTHSLSVDKFNRYKSNKMITTNINNRHVISKFRNHASFIIFCEFLIGNNNKDQCENVLVNITFTILCGHPSNH